jgi:hypothetical protein
MIMNIFGIYHHFSGNYYKIHYIFFNYFVKKVFIHTFHVNMLVQMTPQHF